MQVELIERRPSDECGCPEEEWRISGMTTIIHLEADGSGHIAYDCGDWQEETFVDAPTSIDELRGFAIDYCNDLPSEEDWQARRMGGPSGATHK